MTFYDDNRKKKIFEDSKAIRDRFGILLTDIMIKVSNTFYEERFDWKREDFISYAQGGNAPSMIKYYEGRIYKLAEDLTKLCKAFYYGDMSPIKEIELAFQEEFFKLKSYRMRSFLFETMEGIMKNTMKEMNISEEVNLDEICNPPNECQGGIECSLNWAYGFLSSPFEVNKFPFGNLGFGSFFRYFVTLFTRDALFVTTKFNDIEESFRELLVEVMTKLSSRGSENKIALMAPELVKLIHKDEDAMPGFVNFFQHNYKCGRHEIDDILNEWEKYINNMDINGNSPCKNDFRNQTCCMMFEELLQNQDLKTILKVMKYSIQPVSFIDPLNEFLEAFDNLDFLPYNNLTSHTKMGHVGNLMETNYNPRVWMCSYAGNPKLSPKYCNLFRNSMTNDGIGYTFNNANFWDIFSKTNYTKTFAKIMQPKGYKEKRYNLDYDESDDQWVYPKKGIKFPLQSGPSGGLQVKNNLLVTVKHE